MVHINHSLFNKLETTVHPSLKDAFYKNTATYYISGSNKGHKGIWKYYPDDKDNLVFQNFWGYTPMDWSSGV